MTERKRLGEMLVEAGMIDNMQLQSALGHQKQWGGKLGDILLEMDFISEHVLADFFESHLNIPCLDLSDFEIPANVRGLLKDEIIKKYSVVPIGYENKVLTVAMSDPSDIKTIDELQFATGYRIKPILVFSLDIKRLIQRYFGEEVSPGHQYKSKVHEIAEEKDFELVRDEKQKIQKKEVTVKDYLDAMTSLLIEKGVITREELQKKIRELIK